ncbi:DNA-binding protein [Paramesorhizobium deserti]|uniref:DNA-binding protein n=1 Tax=Paramesorhizobium deserti TaxID=1494590 RepID=A0A135HVK3_9HYPH|nr:type II toxin-antitoxin system VapC family toxin [Paramesorhizobium deserti]KXF77204.1 DNA-binding protein [Paramesorhizobium deserti]
MILVDTNILFDIATLDPHWAEWSFGELQDARMIGRLLINDVIYAELAARYNHIRDLENFIETVGVEMEAIPREALFLAGKVFTRYRKAGGTRTGVLSDFFIGAHAAVLNLSLLTRDEGRYRTYFPTVTLITPSLS